MHASKFQWPVHGKDEIAAVVSVLESGGTNYWRSGHGAAFEADFAAYTGAAHALTCSNGTTALELAIRALCGHAVGWGSVIVPARTFIATASAVDTCGLKPVVADIGDDLNVTADTLEAVWSKDTVAAVVVHYAGLPCDMASILAWGAVRGVKIIEDAAHGHGARIKGQHVGTFGDIGTFSFQAGKIMSLGGEGGMVVTNQGHLHDRMYRRRDHGRYQMQGSADPEYQWSVDEFGTNARMTSMQAAIGLVQLQKLPAWTARRNAIARRYEEIVQPQQWLPPDVIHARYMFLAHAENRGEIIARLNAAGIPARVGACPNIGREPAFRGTARPCPNADRIGERVYSLPIMPTMSDETVDYVCEKLRECVR